MQLLPNSLSQRNKFNNQMKYATSLENTVSWLEVRTVKDSKILC